MLDINLQIDRSTISTAGPSSMKPKNDTGPANGTLILSLPPSRALSGLSRDSRQNAGVTFLGSEAVTKCAPLSPASPRWMLVAAVGCESVGGGRGAVLVQDTVDGVDEDGLQHVTDALIRTATAVPVRFDSAGFPNG